MLGRLEPDISIALRPDISIVVRQFAAQPVLAVKPFRYPVNWVFSEWIPRPPGSSGIGNAMRSPNIGSRRPKRHVEEVS
jgi:hypothetical protein